MIRFLALAGPTYWSLLILLAVIMAALVILQ